MMRNVEIFVFSFMLALHAPVHAQNNLSTVKTLDTQGQLNVKIPQTLSQGELSYAHQRPRSDQKSFFESLHLSLGYVGSESFSIPSSTPQNLNYIPSALPRIALEVQSRPLYTLSSRSQASMFLALQHSQYKSEAKLILSSNEYFDRLRLLSQSVGMGFEIKTAFNQKSLKGHFGFRVSSSIVYALATKGLRSDSVAFFANEQKTALRLYPAWSFADVFVEANLARTQLSQSTQWLKGLSLGISRVL